MGEFDDGLFDQTLTVTISLDDEDSRNGEIIPTNAFSNIERPSTSDYLIMVDDGILIANIPSIIIQVLQQRLNSPGIGTMLNWEYIAGKLGMTIDDISSLRERKNPMEQMLSEFENTQFNNLLLLISEMNRLDVLISLRPHLRNIKDHLIAKNNRPSIENELPLNHISLQGPSRPIAQKQLPEKFILVTHHELPSQPRQQNNNHQMETTSDSAIFVSRDIPEPPQVPNEDPKRKQFKHLWSNLKKWGQTAGITVLDVDKCIDEANTIESLHNHFNRAQQIVLVATEAYREHVCNSHPTPNSKLDIKRQLHEFMYMEYMTAGRQNHRFRVIVTSVEDKAFLPMGWPTSTIVYTFPENHVDIVRRLFENN